MRPRVFPAEDPRIISHLWKGAMSFNEAAGIPRGRLKLFLLGIIEVQCFNEAAGIPRGRRT